MSDELIKDACHESLHRMLRTGLIIQEADYELAATPAQMNRIRCRIRAMDECEETRMPMAPPINPSTGRHYSPFDLGD